MLVPSRQLKVVLLLGVAWLMVACGSASPEAEGTTTTSGVVTTPEDTMADDVLVGLVMPDFSQNELMIAMKDGVDAAAAEYGADLQVVGSNSADDLVRGIEDTVAAGADVLLYNTIDNQAVIPAIADVNEAGIPVVCSVNCAGGGGEGQDVVGEHAMTFGFDYLFVGSLLGEWIVNQSPQPLKIAIIDANRADQGIQNTFDGIDEVIAESGLDIEVVISPPTNWDRAAAVDAARTVLTAHPDVDAIIAMHDIIAAATIDAINELGYKATPLAAMGGTCEGLANILEGNQSATVFLPLYEAGYLGMEAAVRVARNQPVDGGNVPIDVVFIDQDLAQAVADGTNDGMVDGINVSSTIERASGGC